MQLTGLERLSEEGLAGLGGDRLAQIAERAAYHGVSTGDARYIILANMVAAIDRWWDEYAERGGIDARAFREVSESLRTSLPAILVMDDPGGAAVAAASLQEAVDAQMREPSGALATGARSDEEVAAAIAELLLRTREAVAFADEKPFRFASGLASPIYVDCRRLVTDPVTRGVVVEALAQAVTDSGSTAVVGVATGGMPWASWVASKLSLPFGYVRAEAKDRGRARSIEGDLDVSRSVAVVEDLVTTGGSSIRCVQSLREAGFDVACLLSVFSYELEVAGAAMRNAGVEFGYLCGVRQLLETARAGGLVDGSVLLRVGEWLGESDR